MVTSRLLQTFEAIKQLSVRELKAILTANLVDIKVRGTRGRSTRGGVCAVGLTPRVPCLLLRQGCIERRDLLDKLETLWREAQPEEGGTASDDQLCKICFDAKVSCVFLECGRCVTRGSGAKIRQERDSRSVSLFTLLDPGHLVTCVDCGMKLHECPMCRQTMTRHVRVFQS